MVGGMVVKGGMKVVVVVEVERMKKKRMVVMIMIIEAVRAQVLLYLMR